MAKNNLGQWSTTAGDNTDVSGINIAEGCDPGNVNDAMRAMMAQLARAHRASPNFTRKVDLAGAAALIETGMGADDEIILRLHDVVASSRLMMQVSFDSGATWATGDVGDRYTIVHGLAVGAGFSDASSAIILGTASEPPDGTDGSSVEVRITARSVSSVGFVNGGGTSLGLHQMAFHVHPRASTSPISGIRLHLDSGGSFTAGMAYVRRTTI